MLPAAARHCALNSVTSLLHAAASDRPRYRRECCVLRLIEIATGLVAFVFGLSFAPILWWQAGRPIHVMRRRRFRRSAVFCWTVALVFGAISVALRA
jgi:hypothetical protein